jgi:hypothetical protein
VRRGLSPPNRLVLDKRRNRPSGFKLPVTNRDLAEKRFQRQRLLNAERDSYFTHRPRTRLDVSNVSRKLVPSSALILVSVGLAAAFSLLWPRPVSVILAGTSLLCAFAALLALSVVAKPEYVPQAQKAIFFTSGCFGLAFAGLAWKYRASAPAFSSASLIALAMLCFGALATFFFIRSNAGPKSSLKSR